MARPWMIREDTWREHLRWGLISILLIVSIRGLLAVSAGHFSAMVLLWIFAGPAATLIAGDAARRLYILFSMFALAAAFGAFYTLMSAVAPEPEADLPAVTRAEVVARFLIYTCYAAGAVLLYERYKRAREVDAANPMD